mgnify:CR=1 FL=1
MAALAAVEAADVAARVLGARLVAVAAWSGYTVVNYAERHIWASNDAWVLKVCWGAYVLSWLPIVLLPFEVMNADLTRCSINWTFWSWFRHLGWIVLYWTITVRRRAFAPRNSRRRGILPRRLSTSAGCCSTARA